MKEEIEGLIKRGTWKVVCREEIPENANILGSRWVLTIKDEGTNRERWKARFVVKVYDDIMKSRLVHDISTARHHSVRILVAIAAIFGMRIFFLLMLINHF